MIVFLNWIKKTKVYLFYLSLLAVCQQLAIDIMYNQASLSYNSLRNIIYKEFCATESLSLALWLISLVREQWNGMTQDNLG